MSLLGVDVGTTGCKAIVFREDGVILGAAYREYPLLHPKPDWVELDPNQVWQATKESISEAVARAGSGDPVKALAVSSQGEAMTPIDRDGNVLANSIVSFDPRTAPQRDWWEQTWGKKRVFQITGMPLHTMYSLVKMQWIKENQPDVYSKAWKFLCYGDQTLYRLGGVPAIDYSMAGRTMAFDLKAARWSIEILEHAEIDPDLLPDAYPSGTAVGEIYPHIADELGLPRGVKLVTGGHDQPCGALGAGITRPGIAMDATGTVECITPAFDHPVLTDGMLNNNYCCYHHVAPGLYVTIAFSFTGGSLLRWFRDNFADKEAEEAQVSGLDVYDILLAKAGTQPSPVLVLPHFTVTGTPWFDPHSKGVILGLSLSTTKGEIIKALIDGVTYEMRLNLEALEEAGVHISELRAIGGGAKSRIWLQIKADIFKKPVYSLDVSEAACLGAAMLAGAAAGVYSSVHEASEALIHVKERFEPNPEVTPRYDERYHLYKQVYPLLREFLHAM
jgi:xylulokinase